MDPTPPDGWSIDHRSDAVTAWRHDDGRVVVRPNVAARRRCWWRRWADAAVTAMWLAIATFVRWWCGDDLSDDSRR